jgi:hypothetical protein
MIDHAMMFVNEYCMLQRDHVYLEVLLVPGGILSNIYLMID